MDIGSPPRLQKCLGADGIGGIQQLGTAQLSYDYWRANMCVPQIIAEIEVQDDWETGNPARRAIRQSI